MKEIQSKLDHNLIFIFIVIVCMIKKLSLINLIIWAVGISLTFTLLDREGIGVNLMNNTKSNF